ncbi:hypothetical protein HDV05_005587 [Chytridiales sp. JEL 0842]|nr:hypothetical protein HDV05_005587 [Chytridiales sp. JEL 0842]
MADTPSRELRERTRRGKNTPARQQQSSDGSSLSGTTGGAPSPSPATQTRVRSAALAYEAQQVIRRKSARIGTRSVFRAFGASSDTEGQLSDSSTTTPRRQRRSSRRASSSSNPSSRESSPGHRESQEGEDEDDEKENLPDINSAMSGVKRSPWALGVQRIVDAISPARLFRSTPKKASDGHDMPSEAEEDNEENISEGGGEFMTSVEVEYENGEIVTMPVTDEILQEMDQLRDNLEEDIIAQENIHVISDKPTLLSYLFDNRIVDMFKPMLVAIDRFCELVLSILQVVFEWIVVAPFLLPLKLLKFIYNSKPALLLVTLLGSTILYTNFVPGAKLPYNLQQFSKLPESIPSFKSIYTVAQNVQNNLKISEFAATGGDKLASIYNSVTSTFDKASFQIFRTAKEGSGKIWNLFLPTTWFNYTGEKFNGLFGNWTTVGIFPKLRCEQDKEGGSKSFNLFTPSSYFNFTWPAGPNFMAIIESVKLPAIYPGLKSNATASNSSSWNLFFRPSASSKNATAPGPSFFSRLPSITLPSFKNVTWPTFKLSLPSVFGPRHPSIDIDEIIAQEAKESLTRRIEQLESALYNLNKKVSASSTTLSSITKTSTENQQKIKKLAESISGFSSKLDEAFGRLSKVDSKFVNLESASSAAITALRQDMESLSKKLATVTSTVTNSKVPGDLQALSTMVDKVVTRIGSLEKDVKELDASIIKKAKEVLEVHVPPLLVASKDAKGKIVMDPAFYAHLKQMLATQDNVNDITARLGKVEKTIVEINKNRKSANVINNAVSKEDVAAIVKASLTAAGVTKEDLEKERTAFESRVKQALEGFAPAESVEQIKQQLETFVSETSTKGYVTSDDVNQLMNEYDFGKLVREKVNDILQGNGGDGKVVVTRQEVLEVLEEEIVKLKDTVKLEIQAVKENMSGFEARAEALKLDRESVKPLVEAMIKTAMAKFSADLISKPDYALGSAGAWVVPTLTSKTYSTDSQGWFGKMMGQKVVRGWGPFYALTPGTMPGQCWSMGGTNGTLGIHMAMPIIPSAFTIDHVPKELALSAESVANKGGHIHPGLSSAPKDVELWAVLDPFAFASLQLDDPKVRALPTASNPSKVPAGVLLASNRFDPRESNIQTFSTRLDAVKALEKLKAVPDMVVLRIAQNWGHKDYTCLYRVRVHGN